MDPHETYILECNHHVELINRTSTAGWTIQEKTNFRYPMPISVDGSGLIAHARRLLSTKLYRIGTRRKHDAVLLASGAPTDMYGRSGLIGWDVLVDFAS